MALISCPECRAEVSEFAPACPRCGFPISTLNKPAHQGAPRKEPGAYHIGPQGVTPIEQRTHTHITHRETGTLQKSFGDAFGSETGKTAAGCTTAAIMIPIMAVVGIVSIFLFVQMLKSLAY